MRPPACAVPIQLWRLSLDPDGWWSARFVVALTLHTATVNTVRFSPDGRILATAGDDASIFLWEPHPSLGASGADGWARVTAEREVAKRILRGHKSDVYDLSWAPDSTRLLSGSVDNSAIVWDVVRGPWTERERNGGH